MRNENLGINLINHQHISNHWNCTGMSIHEHQLLWCEIGAPGGGTMKKCDGETFDPMRMGDCASWWKIMLLSSWEAKNGSDIHQLFTNHSCYQPFYHVIKWFLSLVILHSCHDRSCHFPSADGMPWAFGNAQWSVLDKYIQ